MAVGDVKLPTVPRTADDATFQLALTQRSALMRADAVECVVAAVNVEQSDDAVGKGRGSLE